MLSNRALWPAMVGIALAVGIGVQMGESAIGAINPIHFQGAAPPVQAIDPSAPPPAILPYAQAYGWEEGNAARLAESGGSDFDYVPQAVVRPAAAPIWQTRSVPVSLTPWPPGQVSSHREIERYTDYPIEAKPEAPPEAERPAPQEDEQAADSDPSGK